MDKSMRKRKGSGGLWVLHILQHIAFVMAVVLGVSVFSGSHMGIENKDGEIVYYNLREEKKDIAFEESQVFSDLFGKNITDLICYGAIRGQLETDGKFDGEKEIDVTAFANRYQGVSSEYITANYYLEDLLKWAKNGLEYEDVFMTGAEADKFLSRMNTVTIVNLEDGEFSGGTVSYLNADLNSITKKVDVSGNSLDSGEYVRDDVTATVLNNRYKTVEGKNIEDHVTTWDEYYKLCQSVHKAAEDLNINYEEYLKYQDYYGEGNTNLVYFIRRTVGKDTQVYTNLQTKSSDIRQLKKELHELCSSYIYYDSQNMEYETNTLIEEKTLRYVMGGYEYAYPEDTQVMVGVRSEFIASDSFSQAKNGFINYVPNYWQGLLGMAFSAVLYFLLLVFLTMKEGKIRRREIGGLGIRLHQEDRFPTELMAIAGAGLFCGLWLLIKFLIREANGADMDTVMPLSGIVALMTSLVFSFFYYSFVRRWKAGTLWRDSFLRKVCMTLKKAVQYLYEHASLVVKVALPFGLLILLNAGVVAFSLLLFVDRSIWIFWLCLLVVLGIDAVAAVGLYRSAQAREKILEGIQKIRAGDTEYKVDETGLYGDSLELAQAVNSIGDSVKEAVETSMKDERLKADLITNVSHDIKTPLTSIINYVDLIKRENIENPKVKEYITVLDAKSQRLKQLTDDLVEASKISSGNIVLQWEKINLKELLSQTIGEFSEKFQEKTLHIVVDAPRENVFIQADSRRIWRVIENLFNNIFKYALPGTRVYIELIVFSEAENRVELSIKNISAQPLKVNPKELTERFIRGDESRTTEGSGLGLSIAKNLTEAQNGTFDIVMDGDLFKVILTFPLLNSGMENKQNQENSK